MDFEEMIVEGFSQNGQTGQVVEETETTETETVEETTEKTTETEETTTEEGIRFKHKDLVLDLDTEAVGKLSKAFGVDDRAFVDTLQKGMNYDHLKDRIDKRYGHIISAVTAFAEKSGQSEGEIVAQLAGVVGEVSGRYEYERAYDDLKKRYPELDENTVDIMAKEKVDTLKIVRERNDRESDNPWVKFFMSHPEIEGADKIPDEVYSLVRSGLEPETAYLRHQLDSRTREVQEMTQKIEGYQKARLTEEKSTGSLSKGTAEEKKDPFIEGWENYL
ncbi:MAG: hypothetical protein GX222_07835 [Ruminococcaceae bacterium]|nr:hypothetical protein [Oscillospiraceae bacterium]